MDLGVVNDSGKQVAYAGPYKLQNADYSEAEWFQKALGKDHYVSDVFLRSSRFSSPGFSSSTGSKVEKNGFCGPPLILSHSKRWWRK